MSAESKKGPAKPGPEILPEKTGLYSPERQPEELGNLNAGQFNQLHSSDTPEEKVKRDK